MPEPSRFQRELRSVMAEKKKAGVEVLDLTEGDPVIFGHTNQPLSDTLVEAAEGGWHMYPEQTPWRDELRKAISGFEKRYRKIEYNPEDIIVGPGVAGSFQTLHYSLLEPGDEMVVVEPAHYLMGPTSYWYYFQSKVVTSPCSEEDGWDPVVEELPSKITSKTKGIVIVNPNNPTGAVYSERALKGIVDIAGENDLPIISDEIYGLITFDGIVAKPTAEIAKDVPVIALSGMSKIFMRTGWRVGYICFHDLEEKISELARVTKRVAGLYGHGTTVMPTPILYAATKAFEGSIDAGMEMTKKLQVHRDNIMKRIQEIEGVTCVKPKGTLYCFPKVDVIGKTWKTDEEFMLELVKEENVIFNIGSEYGPSGFGHFRLLLLPDISIIDDALNRLEYFLKRHRN
jgi:aspartate/methionine/tyrosine aminotransferase